MHTLCLPELVCKLEAFIHDHALARRKPGPKPKLSLAQLAAICIVKASWRVPCWKDFFQHPATMAGWKQAEGFELGSYGRLMLRLCEANRVMTAWLEHHREPWEGLGAIDSTLIPLGKPWNRYDRSKYKRIRREGAAAGVGSTGPCFGVKLHLATTAGGQIHGASITSASTHDLNPVKEGLLNNAIGIVLGDSGYVSHKEAKRLQQKSVALWAKPARHHEATFCPIQARLYRFREVAEGVFAKLKQTFGLVPQWPPRTMATCRAHILGVLVAYILTPGKPTMKWATHHFRAT